MSGSTAEETRELSETCCRSRMSSWMTEIDVVMKHTWIKHITVLEDGPAQRAAGRTDRKRSLLRATLCVCVSVAFVAIVSLKSADAPRLDTDATAERKIQLLHRHLQTLHYLKFGGTLIGDTGVEAGNLGAYWNFAETSPTAHGGLIDGGVGAYGTWGIDSVEPSGEAYGEGQKKAESAFVASRKSALGIVENDEIFDTAAAGAAAGPSWDDGSRGYGGAGLGGGEALDGGVHADFGANVDGMRCGI